MYKSTAHLLLISLLMIFLINQLVIKNVEFLNQCFPKP